MENEIDIPPENRKTRPTSNDTSWDVATERFPRRPFPWEAFPSSIAESLKQAARSCATSDVAMPGAAMAIMASALGRAVITSPKKSWEEPMIFWVSDIRSSGQGKTPPVRMLLNPVYQAQKRTDDNYQAEFDRWLSLPKKSRGAPPNRARGHFVTDLTLEGLRMEVQTGHGGLICVMDELSSMISAQNQYKLKGNDRESWLALWDGYDARISRVSKSTTIRGCRISIFGGLQPVVFAMAFCGDNGVYLNDGTLFRFLFTYERDSFVPLTDESWSDENRNIWESTLTNAMTWADGITSVDEWTPHILRLSNDARKYLVPYRNNLLEGTKQLPTPIQGFLPKAISYVLRIAGLLHCMFQFANQTQPGDTLDVEDIKQSISVVEFYLANAVSAMRLIEDRLDTRAINETTVTLAKTLEQLRADLDSGRLAVGYIHEIFNEQCNILLKVKSEKAMGTILREHGLTMAPGKHDANDRRGVCCLIWDKKADQFVRTLQTSAIQSPYEETEAGTGRTDIADIADIVGGEEYEIEGNIL